MAKKKYRIQFKGRILLTKMTEKEAKIGLRRIYAGYKNVRKLPKKVPKKFGKVIKIK